MTPIGRRCLLSVLLLSASVAVHGQIVLTNYNNANPLKIMPLGDSITDDCVVPGAWRKPLQPLLEASGFPFTFVGREVYAPIGTFTKTNHEGHCGATIAAPGIFGDGHEYAPALNYLQYIAPQAFTNAIPDVLLILIGANDIGNGRDPFVLATNNVATLLNIIFSNAPNVTVVLAKATRQDSVTAYGTNIPIYNAALQGLASQRRALGQKVYLADLYTVVVYPSMFRSDNLHLNDTGLQVAANEWLARLQTIAIQTNLIVTNFIYGGANWTYNDTGQDLGTNWAQPGYDDSGWSNGPARLGYGDPGTATTVSFGPQSTNKYVTTYFRRPFVVPQNAVITNLNFRVVQSDGVLLWLNGQEIYRANLPAGPISYTTRARFQLTYYLRYNFYAANVPVSNLPAGTNWLTAEVHLSSTNSPTMGFDMELIGTGYPAPSLSIAPAGDNVLCSWPMSGGNFKLYATTNLADTASWTTVSAALQTNNGQITVTQALDANAKFFRLQQP